MAAYSHNWYATGTIQPSRFVSVDRTAGILHGVKQSPATDNYVIGIAQPGSFDPPGVNGSATDAARVGDELQVYGPGEECILEIGGTVTAGDFLQPDANGKGVTINLAGAGTTFTIYGARALEAGVAGDKIRVSVMIGSLTLA